MPQPVQASTYTFRHLIDGGFLYVDKTRHLYDLVHPGTGLYFLARPRRFGKSLMLSTLEEIFLGNRALFEGLWIDTSDYDWQTYPVVHIDFSWSTIHDANALQQAIDSYIEEIAESHGITVRGYDYQSRFRNLLLQLSKEGRLVLLIDEYDKPLIDNLENLPVAIEIRDTLRSFYGIIKSMDRYLRFVLITGISKFSKVGVFSVLNNLTDLTMSPHFATALGITEEELTTYFADHIDAFARQEGLTSTTFVAKMRQWYDGFCFVEESLSVYNPFSTLQLFYNQRFSNYWFETGTPTFLIKLLKSQHFEIETLNDLRLRELGFSTYELDSLSVVPLLFQTGYLTIKAYEPTRRVYTLGYPNSEVEDAFLTYLLSEFSERDRGLSEDTLWQLIDALEGHDLDRFFSVLTIFFANVPYDLQIKQEKYYQTIFYLIFKLLGLRVDAEVRTNQGRIDAVVEVTDQIYLFEFKLDKSADEALQQIQEHHYYQKYQQRTKALTLIGANFDSTQRQISGWQSAASEG